MEAFFITIYLVFIYYIFCIIYYLVFITKLSIVLASNSQNIQYWPSAAPLGIGGNFTNDFRENRDRPILNILENPSISNEKSDLTLITNKRSSAIDFLETGSSDPCSFTVNHLSFLSTRCRNNLL